MEFLPGCCRSAFSRARQSHPRTVTSMLKSASQSAAIPSKSFSAAIRRKGLLSTASHKLRSLADFRALPRPSTRTASHCGRSPSQLGTGGVQHHRTRRLLVIRLTSARILPMTSWNIWQTSLGCLDHRRTGCSGAAARTF